MKTLRASNFIAPIGYRVSAIFFIAACLSGLSGCQRYSYEGGWRRARVVEIIHGKDIQHPLQRQCLANLSVEEIARSDFVVVSYPRGRWLRYQTFPDVQKLDFVPGQTVWVNPTRCDGALQMTPPA